MPDNTTSNRPQPPLPAQQQRPPGRTAEMNPQPDHGEASYKGRGKLAGKVALITGGDSGIGRAVAIAFAREGADVVISYLNEDDDAATTAKWVRDAGRQALTIPGDISTPAQCKVLIDKTLEKFGRLDVLVNNAAMQRTHAHISEISDEEWDETFRTNVYAMFYLCKHAVQVMKPGAAIINTSSINEDNPSPALLAYATTKGAVANFTAGRQGWHSRERGCSRPHLDTVDSVDNERHREIRWQHAHGPARTTRRTGTGLCIAGVG
jgi:NADP-dependent 3-hydroxy acid dehydrogenase YdfG